MGKQKTKGFTLVELIIVITILAILGSIAFVSYNEYIVHSRDSQRKSNLTNIEKSLHIFNTKYGKYPIPDNSVEISYSGTNLVYQGNIGDSNSSLLGLSITPIDPSNGEKIIYNVSNTQKSFQIQSFLEKTNDIAFFSNIASAELFRDNFMINGYGVGVVLDGNKNYLTGNIDLKTYSGSYFNLYLPGLEKPIYADGITIANGIMNLSKRNGVFSAPSNCIEGFIGVPGNPNFMQPGFCVAKYEMSYKDDLLPTSAGSWFTTGIASNPSCTYGADNVVNDGESCTPNDFKNINGGIVSENGNYPITELTQSESIQACLSINTHLITNNEWMTISRNIEKTSLNWSGGIVGNNYLFTGLSNSLMGCGVTQSRYIYGSYSIKRWGAKTGRGGVEFCDNLRKLVLNNKEEIYDFSGNVWEHVNKNNTLNGDNYSKNHLTINGSSNTTGRDDDGIYLLSDINNYGSFYNLGITSGLGNVYYSSGVDDNILIRGGDAGAGDNTGIYTMILHRTSNHYGDNIGFRCAY